MNKQTPSSVEYFLGFVDDTCQKFEPISLKEMDGVKLMDRVDVKYLIPLYLLPTILNEAKSYFRILEVNQKRICTYNTLYYDTENLDLYNNHQCGRTNRYKIRFRNYVDSELSFFEIKFKNNKGRTIKTRIKQPNKFEMDLSGEKSLFLNNSTPLSSDSLHGNLWVHYERMTLVNKTSAERVTIDTNLRFDTNVSSKKYPQFAIAEIKQERIGASPIIDILRKHELRKGSISKYCLGIISTQENIKANRFKTNLLHLTKIINQYDSLASTY